MGNKPIKGGLKGGAAVTISAHTATPSMAADAVSAQMSQPHLLSDHFAKDMMNVEIARELEEVSAKIDIHDFRVLKVLGRGTFGKVMLVELVEEGKVFALKSLRKKHIIKSMQVEHTRSERRILEKLEHPFIVPLRYAFQTKSKLYMVFDYIPGGELFQHLKTEEFFKEDRARFYAAEIFLALEFLHGKNIVYRDLKPENILLDQQGHIKVTDFGLAKELNIEEREAGRTTTFCGTDEYLAPELILHQPYGKSVDYWALGILIYEMLTGWPPWEDANRKLLYDKILKLPLDLSHENLSPIAKDLLRKMLEKKVSDRIKPEDIKKHPFFAGIDWVKLYAKMVAPPFKPKLTSQTDVSNFDPAFTNENPMKESPNQQTPNTGSSKKESYFGGFTFIPSPSAENNEGVAVGKIK